MPVYPQFLPPHFFTFSFFPLTETSPVETGELVCGQQKPTHRRTSLGRGGAVPPSTPSEGIG